MKIIGLTGSIASGKSTTARMLRRLRIPVFDSDAAAHDLMGKGGAAHPILCDVFPDCVDEDGSINRKKLGQKVFEDVPEFKPVLEGILHPLIRLATNRFIQTCQRQRRRACVIDIPLLFETGAEDRFDVIWCQSVPKTVQMRRLRGRGITTRKANAILKAQMPQRQKIRRSDLVLNSARGYNHVMRHIKTAICRLVREE